MTIIPTLKNYTTSLYRSSTQALNNPVLFNTVRSFMAGDQHETKEFVRKNIAQYNCKSVLDVGCGTGDFAEMIPPEIKYLGSDLNKNFINYAKKRYAKEENKIFITEDSLSSKNKEKYDAILFISMMHHFSDEELPVILDMIRKRTRKLLLVADIIPNPPHLVQRIAADLDRGKFVRPQQEKIKFLREGFSIKNISLLHSRLAVQCAIICEPIQR